MKKREWFFVFVPLTLVWYFDRVTKYWAQDLSLMKSFGFLRFALHRNQGAMLGLFSDLPAFLRIVSLSTGGAFLVVTFALIQYLMPLRSMSSRVGLSLILGGVLGNVTDRIVWGYVVDFIFFMKEGSFSTPVFNIADLMQWLGYGLVFYAVVKDGSTERPDQNTRKLQWLNPRFQLKYCFILLGVGFSISLICAVFSYTYLRVSLLEVVGANPELLQKFLDPFAYTFAVVTVAFSIGLFTVGKIFSQQVAGPIYAFEKYIQEIFEIIDKSQITPGAGAQSTPTLRPFRVRGKDAFQELETLAELIRQRVTTPTQKPDDPIDPKDHIKLL